MPEQNESASSMTNVLIIDDENQIRKFLDIALRAQGYKTLLAENGQKGLELLALQGADLVILDLGLPDLDGYEVLSELRTWSHVPVIVLSVRANEEEKVKLLDAGANDYVTKPFSVQELVARIRVLLRQHQHNIQDMSGAIEQNRSSLPPQYAGMTRQDLIKQVVESKEMQMLAKYNVQCDFK